MNPTIGILVLDRKIVEKMPPSIPTGIPFMDTPVWTINNESLDYATSFVDIGQFYNYLETHHSIPIPEVWGEGTGLVQRRLQEIMDNRTKQQEKIYAEIVAKQQGWKWPKGKPKVFCYTTLFSTVMKYQAQGLMKGFDKIGCETMFMMEQDPRERYHNDTVGHYIDLMNAISEFEPDLIVNLNFYRLPEMHGMTIPVYTWVQDRIRNFSPAQANDIRDNDFIGIMLRGWVDRWKGYGFPEKQIMEHPCNYDPDIFYPGNEKREGIVYVEQNGARTPFEMFKQLHQRHSAEVRVKMLEFFGRCSDLFSLGADLFESDYKKIMDGVEKDLGGKPLAEIMGPEQKELMMHDYYREVGNRWIRQRPLAQLKDLPLSLYGNGWERHPILGKCAKGAIDYSELPSIYRKAQVVLQVQHEATFVHRTVEGLACGAHMMAKHIDTDAAPARDYVKCTEFTRNTAIETANTLLQTTPPTLEQSGILDYRYEVWAQKIIDWIGSRQC